MERAPLESRYVSGRGNNKRLGKAGIFTSKKMKRDFYFDSSWELARMERLESDQSVKSYKRTPVRLTYQFEGRSHFYFPDFSATYKDGTICIEEVKPERWLIYKNNQAKIKALKAYCRKRGYVCRILKTLEACKET